MKGYFHFLTDLFNRANTTGRFYRKRKLHKSKLSLTPKRKVASCVGRLCEEGKKLKGRDGFRIRVANYRIIYDIFDNILSVDVIDLGHRKDIYE